MNFRQGNFLIFALSMAFSYPSLAVFLGDLSVYSGNYQPLRALVSLEDYRWGELPEVKVSVASRNEFSSLNVAYSREAQAIKPVVGVDPMGRYSVLLMTDTNVLHSGLSFVLRLEWNGGEVIQRYDVDTNATVATASYQKPAYQTLKQARPAPQATAPAALVPKLLYEQTVGPSVLETMPDTWSDDDTGGAVEIIIGGQ